jgi:hypothetical protein
VLVSAGSPVVVSPPATNHSILSVLVSTGSPVVMSPPATNHKSLIRLSAIFIFQIDCLSLFLKSSLKTLSNESSTFCSNKAADELGASAIIVETEQLMLFSVLNLFCFTSHRQFKNQC